MTEALQLEIRTLRSLHNSERDPEGRVFAPLADAYRRAGQIPEAVRLLNDGLSRLPDFVPGHVVAAQLYVEQGLAEEAGFAARRALELDPDNVNALRSLLRVLEGTGQGAEATEVRDHLVALEPDFRAESATIAGDGVSAGTPTRSSSPETLMLDDADSPAAEPVFDLGDLTLRAEAEPAADAAFGAGPDESIVVGLDALAPDAEPVFELSSLAVREETDDVLDIGLLSADEPEPEPIDMAALPEEEPVFDLAALAPDEPEEPVLDTAALAPDEPAEEPVLDMAALAPDEPEEPVLDMAALAPDEPEEPVFDMAALAPDEPEELVFDMAALAPDEPEEPVLDMAALAPDEPEEPVFDMDALAPEPAARTAVDEVVEVDFLAPDDPDEVVIDMDALRPDGVDPEGSEEEAETVAPVADDELDDEEAGEPVYTRTLAELYVKQGAVDRALGVLRHLFEADADNRELADRIAQLEAGGDGADAQAEQEQPVDRRTWRPEESEGADEAEEVESLARDLAQSGEGGHDIDSPFAWGEQEAEAPPAEGPTIRDYFDGLLSWEPGEDE